MEILIAMVDFAVLDYKSLIQSSELYDGLFGGFIWSHIPIEELVEFIRIMLLQVQPGGQMVFIDNLYVEGNSTPISRFDQKGNGYQNRTLTNGDTYEVIKNYPQENELSVLFESFDVDIKWTEFDYYWILDIKKF